ncbi:MAG: hypothetical protein ACFBSD_02300 [Paracoccaceae bacterium]
MSAGATAQTGTAPSYRLSFLPDEQTNLICFSRTDALALLIEFRRRYLAEERPRVRRLIRSFEPELGPDNRYDCGLVASIYVPTQPIEAVDLAFERGLDWGDKDEHFFVAASLLVGETRYTMTAQGTPIYVFTSDFVILKQ